MLRIAIAFDRTRRSVITGVSVALSDAELYIVGLVDDDADASVEIFTANSRSAMLAEVAERKVLVAPSKPPGTKPD